MCLFFGLENGEEIFCTQHAKWISTFWSYSCARFHLSMCTLSLEHVHASSWLYACFEHVHASTWACACFHWSMCILPLGYMHTYTWTYVCFQLSLCMLSLEHGCVFSWVCARFHLSLYRLTFSMCSPVLLWAQVNLWKTGRNKQATGTEQFKHIPWKFFRRHGHPCVPYPLFPLFRASIDIIYSRFTHTFPS